MPWKRMLGYVTGEVEEWLLLRIEYLIEENRVLRDQLEKRILLTDAERRILAERAVALGRLICPVVALAKTDGRHRHHRQARDDPQMAQKAGPVRREVTAARRD